MFSTRFSTRAILTSAFVALAAAPALAGSDIYRGDGTTRAGKTLAFSYAAPNFCPAGLEPVLAHGEVLCCKPNTTARYHNPTAVRHVARPRSRAASSYAPEVYAPVGVKGVVYR